PVRASWPRPSAMYSTVRLLNSVMPDAPIPASWKEIPARTEESDAMSKALQKRGFTFVGSTICYAFMQSVGMVNDHLAGCPARNAVAHRTLEGRQASF
ncbi:MAG TPA: DNA-3-methyladenine glycosylase I, partial [Tepidiformaceae bacterium]|nr:DNA-3-methyladenine glycosylase I [Tepidiformaceae bacterium]